MAAIKGVCLRLPAKASAELRTDINRLLNKDNPQAQHSLFKRVQGSQGVYKGTVPGLFLMVDMGMNMVVMDRQDYINKAHDVLMDKDT